MTDLPDALLEAAGLFVDHNGLPTHDVRGSDYMTWMHEWDDRLHNLAATVALYRKAAA